MMITDSQCAKDQEGSEVGADDHEHVGQVADDHIKAVLKPPMTLTVRETRVLDYLTSLNPHGESQQPEAAVSPTATFRAIAMVRRILLLDFPQSAKQEDDSKTVSHIFKYNCSISSS